MILEQVIEMWMDEKKNFVKESTYAHYCFEVNKYLLPALGHLEMGQLTEECIQKTVLEWQCGEKGTGHSLQKSSVQNLVVLLKQVLKFASKKGYADDYMLDIHFKPQIADKKQQVYTRAEQEKLIQAILDDLSFRSFGILLSISSGMRIGELCALKWNDVDMEEQIVHVRRTLQRIYMADAQPSTQIIITPPKSNASIRDIPLSDRLCKVIRQLEDINPDGYVLTNSEHYMEPRTMRRFFKSFLEQHDISRLHFHCLRHTFATRCIESGADCKCVSEILGHMSVNTTLNMYVHPQIEEKRKCVELIQW